MVLQSPVKVTKLLVRGAHRLVEGLEVFGEPGDRTEQLGLRLETEQIRQLGKIPREECALIFGVVECRGSGQSSLRL